MKQAVMFGAGNVGRGFIGQLFCESGYLVTFVDVDDVLIEALNRRGQYTLRLVDNENIQEIMVAPVRALHSNRDAQAAAEALERAELAATAVGARVLPYVAPLAAAGIRRRMQAGNTAALNIIICENLKDAAAAFRAMVYEHLNTEERAFADERVGFVDTVIGRMVPPLTAEMRAQDPSLIVVEPYKELPVDRRGFAGEIPSVVGMEPCDNFPAYTARKLYIHNCGHAVLAYLGYLGGYAYGYEALVDAGVRARIEQALAESRQGIVAEYGVDGAWLDAHARELMHRYANRVLADTIFRLGRDPQRKLAPKDRLVGAARLAEKAGVRPDGLAWGIAAGYCFSAAEDPMAVELQESIRRDGFAAVLQAVSQIRVDEPLGELVRERYAALQEQARR
jgi:mannitol-1-phosphate 5-dehydrogenase